jgi:sugar phosphate isomerase/epimerase
LSKYHWNRLSGKYKEAGYDGVEMALPFKPEEKAEFLALLQKYQLLYIA